VWFSAQAVVLVAILAIAVLGVTGRLTRQHPRATPRPAPRHHHLSFRHLLTH
jgi:hypothetical protein